VGAARGRGSRARLAGVTAALLGGAKNAAPYKHPQERTLSHAPRQGDIASLTI